MGETSLADLAEPEVIKAEAMTITGFSEHYTLSGSAEIPGQWQRFAPHIETIDGQVEPGVTYGVICNGDDDGFDYLTGVQVGSGAEAAKALTRLTIPAQTYAVFQHPGHVSEVRRTCNTIWSEWLPRSGYEAVGAPWFERYPERFDPMTGTGGLEVWIPVAVGGEWFLASRQGATFSTSFEKADSLPSESKAVIATK